MLSGVSGGLAEYFQIDPVLVRLLFVVTTCAGGGGLLAYIILSIVVPEAPPVAEEPEPSSSDLPSSAAEIPAVPLGWSDERQSVRNRQRAAGFILLAIGLLFLLGNFFNLDWGSVWRLWPVLLIVGGGVLLLRHTRRGRTIK